MQNMTQELLNFLLTYLQLIIKLPILIHSIVGNILHLFLACPSALSLLFDCQDPCNLPRSCVPVIHLRILASNVKFLSKYTKNLWIDSNNDLLRIACIVLSSQNPSFLFSFDLILAVERRFQSKCFHYEANSKYFVFQLPSVRFLKINTL